MEQTTQVNQITLTPLAVEKVKEIMAKQPESYEGLRVAVVGGGCSGHSYHMGFEKSIGLNDQVFEFDGLKVIVDPHSLSFIRGTEIDYVDGIQGTGFKFSNPNARSTCGCGESFNA